MASVSYNYYVGNGVKKDYEFAQELNTQATVYGLVNQAEVAGTWDSGTGFFTFTVAPASGADIWIARRTSNDTAIATYPNKSYINSENLDADFRQSLMQVQELQFDVSQSNLLNANVPSYAFEAAASAAAAELAETNAETAETNAAASAAAALVSENNAAATLANAVTKDGLTPMDSAADLTFSGGGEVLGLPATPSATGASSKEYTDTQDALALPLAGGTVTGQIKGITPVADADLTRKDYVDTVAAKRNVIINGNFDIWQRGTSFAAAATGQHSADRFEYVKSGAMVHTLSQGASVPTYAESGVKSNYNMYADVTTVDSSIAAGDYARFQYKVEGHDYARIAGGNAVLTFWVSATKTGTHCVAFRNSGNDRSYVVEYTVDVADTWEKKTITVPLTETAGTWDYTTGIGLNISWSLAAGSTYQTTADAWQTGNYVATSNQVNACDNTLNNFRIAQVQLEKGDNATPFEYESYADTFNKCLRYYEILGANGYSAAYHRFSAGFCVSTVLSRTSIFFTEKRDTPTLTDSGSTTFAILHGSSTHTVGSAISVVVLGRTSASLDLTVASGLTVGQGCIIRANNNSATSIQVSAEL